MKNSFLLVALFVSLAFANSYYVSTMGDSEMNNCTMPSVPCATIQDALQKGRDDGASTINIYLASGNYNVTQQLDYTGVQGSLQGSEDNVVVMYQDSVHNYSPFNINQTFLLKNLELMPLDTVNGFGGNVFHTPARDFGTEFEIQVDMTILTDFVRIVYLDDNKGSITITNSMIGNYNFPCKDSTIFGRDVTIGIMNSVIETPCAFVESYSSDTEIDSTSFTMVPGIDALNGTYPYFVVASTYGSFTSDKTSFMNYITVGGVLYFNNIPGFQVTGATFMGNSLVEAFNDDFDPSQKAAAMASVESYGMLSDTVFKKNSNQIGSALGGAIFMMSSDNIDAPSDTMQTFDNCTFDHNNATTGSAIAITSFGIPVAVMNSQFTNNMAIDDGTILVQNTCTYQFTDNVFTNNMAATGAIIDCTSCSGSKSISFDGTMYSGNTNTNSDGENDTCGTLPASVAPMVPTPSITLLPSDSFPTAYVVGPIAGVICLAGLLVLFAGLAYTVISLRKRNSYESI